MFTMEGRLVEQIGQEGNGCSEFSYPASVCVHPIAKTIVADSDNHRIQVFSNNLKFSHVFGTNGPQPGQFDWPSDVTVDNHGHCYITDYNNHRIQKFTLEGEFIAQFGSQRNGEGQL